MTMNEQQIADLYEELLDAPPGRAMRLGIKGNTPTQIRERWELLNALDDHQTKRRREREAAGLTQPARRIFGLPALREAFGDLDRLESSPVLRWQMEEHLSAQELSEEVLDRLVNDAIQDARNPERRPRVPEYWEASGWWKEEAENYTRTDGGNPGGSERLDADEAIQLLRQRVLEAYEHSVAMAEHPSTRLEAERYIKQELVKFQSLVSDAATKQYKVAQAFRGRQNERGGSGEIHGRLKFGERRAEQRAYALMAYSDALDTAGKPTTPFMAGVRRALSERFPGQEAEILKSKAGTLMEESSVEAALKLTPKDPKTWDPETDNVVERAHRLHLASSQREQLDWETKKKRDDLPRGHRLNGQALAAACYDAMDPGQRRLSDSWKNLGKAAKTQADAEPNGYNGDVARGYASMVGLPPMPAVPPIVSARGSTTVRTVQAGMVERATAASYSGAGSPSPAGPSTSADLGG